MAVLLSRCRPNKPIYAFTNTSHVRRRLAIHWGVQAFIVKFSKAPETTISRAIKLLTEKNIVSAGDRVIVVSDILADGKFVETVQVRII
jgi:pyruvate kinase